VPHDSTKDRAELQRVAPDDFEIASMTWHDVEQFIPFIKPLFDGLRSARDFFTRDKTKKPEHSIEIPKKTLILIPGIQPTSLLWGLGKAGAKGGMQINGDLQATNTSNYNIRLAGIKLLEPAGVEILAQMALVKDHKTGYSSSDYLIPTRSIGDVGFMFFAVPATGVPGKPLKAAISILDQFGNEHVLRNLICKYIGPEEPSPELASHRWHSAILASALRFLQRTQLRSACRKRTVVH
jgi:hypothetical protein